MKLDLLNSRFPVPKNHRVIDSLEDQPIPETSHNLSKSSLVKMSITPVKIRANQSRGLAKQVPTRFDVAKVDRNGHYVEVYERASNAKPTILYDKPCHADLATRSSDSIIDTFFPPSLESEKKNELSSSPTLDKIKDRIHDYDDYTVQSRIESKNLPGTIARAKRDMNPKGVIGLTTLAHVGPCTYDSSHLLTQSVPNIFLPNEKQAYFTVEEYKAKPHVTPLKERLRLDRMQEQYEREHAEQVTLKQQFSHHIPDIEFDRILRKKHNPRIQFDNSNIGRFDAVEYRKEAYVKTTGLLLSPHYDEKFSKKIPFAFETSGNATSIFDVKNNASKDVDVDVGKHFALVTELHRSPIKYAAAFKSKQPSGMQIRAPTTAPHIGPGTFSHIHKSAVEVVRPEHLSLAFLASRIDYTRPPMPDLYEVPKTFAEANTKGPIFPTEQNPGGGSALNLHLTKIVKEKMARIYPKLASKKFPEKKVGEEEGEEVNGENDYSIKKKKNFVFKKTKKIV